MAAFAASFTTNFDREQHLTGDGIQQTDSGARGYLHQEQEAHLQERGGSSEDASTPPTAVSEEDYRQGGDDHVHDMNSAQTEKAVLKLARNASRLSTQTESQNPFSDSKDPRLDPHSPSFNARAYAEAVLGVHSRDERAVPLRQAGVAFKNLTARGYGSDSDYQKTVSNAPLSLMHAVRGVLGKKPRQINILHSFDGLVKAGEMCVVLGPPGSGCSTFLKTITGETHGFFIDESSSVNYQGISAKQMHKDFRGEAIYTAEVDVHFPQLTVGQTLAFAAEARAPRHPLGGLTRRQYAEHSRDVIMAIFGISHTINTRVGNDFLRGVSGGERKRVSIAEAALSGAPLQCWDNSTRGLDSANAIEFCKTLRNSTDLMGATAFVAIYQSPQSAYDVFDKVTVLYEGRQIYFGPCNEARQFFIDMGFEPPERQTTPDFLTSLTSPQERKARAGYENRVPRTPDEFVQRWKASETYRRLIAEIEEYNNQYPVGGEALELFKQSRRAQQAKRQRVKSPYTLSYVQQIALCLRRGFWRLKADPSLTLTQLIGNSVMNLIISSVFFNLQPTTTSFFQRGSLLFFAILTNAFGAALEILTLYAQRPIVEKQSRYALYHPSAEAWASMITDLPYKLVNAIFSNLVLYFMTNLRREVGPFFFYLFVAFILQLTMSMVFRTIASASRTFVGAMTPTVVLMLALIIYTGFALPISYMPGWSRWINYLDPIGYGFEALMLNEFVGRRFACDSFVPQGPTYNAGGTSQACAAVGSVLGQNYVEGSVYLETLYQYVDSHKWRNVGIIIAELFFFLGTYMIAAELVSAKKSKGEVLVWRRGHDPHTKAIKDDPENAMKGEKGALTGKSGADELENGDVHIQKQTAIFHWRDVCYDIQIKKETRRILDHVDGWVKPGQLTALMGVSGAGKTTLLDVLATRVTMGVVTGEMLVDGRERDQSFQRKTGYVQQQDLHLETSTVREALEFSALLRQPAHIPRAEKIAYVDEVIRLLDMQAYSDAVVGVPGEGLNVEQRKRLTIGVELAAKPQLLLFLDEPTSGLDSQTSWAIADLMEKLTAHGQAILCTIHQPSAILFQRFDRLLFLAKGGKTVYFGEVGENSHILIKYFERNGGFPCPPDANPAEWMLEVIGAAPGSHTDVDWHQAWLNSPERVGVRQHLDELKNERPKIAAPATSADDKTSYRAFAAPFSVQARETTKRVFQQYWRTPSYIFSKAFLVTAAGLFIGFSFYNSPLTQQGLQNQLFSIFMVFIIFGQLVQQIMPQFVTQRALYEARERPAKTYAWPAFILANVIVELPYCLMMAVILYFTWAYPIGYYKNAIPTDAVHERGALLFLFVLEFLLFSSTFAHFVVAAMDTAETAGNIANLMFSLCLIFCGVLATPSQFPGFWIFMYRLSPFTYLVSGIIATGLANTDVVCAANEYVRFNPVGGQNCGDYVRQYTQTFGGYVANPTAATDCQFCSISSTNTFLAAVNANYDQRWRNFGILFAFIAFNSIAAFGLYWLGRVPKKTKKAKKTKKE